MDAYSWHVGQRVGAGELGIALNAELSFRANSAFKAIPKFPSPDSLPQVSQMGWSISFYQGWPIW
eukprot:4346486-Pyramimonas_sp.AAC.1